VKRKGNKSSCLPLYKRGIKGDWEKDIRKRGSRRLKRVEKGARRLKGYKKG